jgi:hypothetical protein
VAARPFVDETTSNELTECRVHVAIRLCELDCSCAKPTIRMLLLLTIQYFRERPRTNFCAITARHCLLPGGRSLILQLQLKRRPPGTPMKLPLHFSLTPMKRPGSMYKVHVTQKCASYPALSRIPGLSPRNHVHKTLVVYHDHTIEVQVAMYRRDLLGNIDNDNRLAVDQYMVASPCRVVLYLSMRCHRTYDSK